MKKFGRSDGLEATMRWRGRMPIALWLVLGLCSGGCAGGGGQPSFAAQPTTGGHARLRAPASQESSRPLEIALPEILAIELPSDDTKEIAPDQPPLRGLLESATAGGFQVTHDRNSPVGIGATEVTWTAWSGEPGASAVQATRRAWVYVFPFGQTPIGVSRDDHATAGNNSAKVVRDGSGMVHAAWLDSGRPGASPRVMYRRGVQDPATGAVRWVTAPSQVGGPVTGVSYVGIEASESAVHLVWFGGRATIYRRLIHRENGWILEPMRTVGTLGHSYETSPAIAVRGDGEIHVLTATGSYAVSADGGVRWAIDQIPLPVGMRLKNPAMAVDATGNVHVVFNGVVRGPREGYTSQRPNGAYWELRYVRRPAGGGWVDGQNVLATFPAWADAGNAKDTLSDWPTIAADTTGNLYVAWHGTIPSHVFGRDEAYLIRRPAVGTGTWEPWEPPHRLHPVSPGKEEYSFAPSLAVDPRSDRVVAVIFYQVAGAGSQVFDSEAHVLQGDALASAPIPLSQMARMAVEAGRPDDAPSTWFPSAGPRLFHRHDGSVWLDVLSTVATPDAHKAPYLIVFQTRRIGGSTLPKGSSVKAIGSGVR
jgi:hypothetical protein